MIGILYLIVFIFTIILEVSIVKKSKGKRIFWIVIYLFLCIIGILVGSLLGKKISFLNADLLMLSSTSKVGVMHGFVFVPISVLLFVYLYKIKKLNLGFTIIFSLEALGITLGTFFLLLLS